VTQRVGLLRQNRGRRGESISFEYDEARLKNSNCFSLEPALSLTPDTFHPSQDRAIFGSIGDSAPDTWGRQLMQRAERRHAEAEKCTVRTLSELDYLLGVSDETRLGALRFRRAGDDAFQTPFDKGVPVINDWLQRRRAKGSYPEIVDALTHHGARPKQDAHGLYRRVAFNVLISNVDDHLRNHGFLWLDRNGWFLSLAYDLNPTPTDVKARILTTNIDLDDGTCSLDLLESASEYFDLNLKAARSVIKEVALATSKWRAVAKNVGARSAEIDRMSSAFEHDDLKKALAL
jgi:HipA-like protein